MDDKLDLKQVISSVAKQEKETEKKAEETVQLVVFQLDQEEYGVEINSLREIVKLQTITPVPGSPDFVCGILNLRGKIIVVVDLEKKFHLARAEKTKQEHIIVTELEENNFGILVDKVTEVLRIPVSKIQPAPALVSTKIHADYLKGVVVLENVDTKKSRLIILIDLLKLLNEDKLLELGQEIKSEVDKNKHDI